MKIGFVTASISRNAGGMFESIPGLARELCKRHSVAVFGLSDEYSDLDTPSWAPLRPETFGVLGPSAFGYAPKLFQRLCESNMDVLHSQGIWMYPSLATQRWGAKTKKPYLNSIHGMLDPVMLCKSRGKKFIAQMVYENAHLRDAFCLHALNSEELQAIREYGLKNAVCVIPNGVQLDYPDVNTDAWSGIIPDDCKLLLYLGRLHPKKGLLALIDGFNAIRGKSSAQDWYIAIAGWDQGGYETQLKALIARLNLSVRIKLVGPLFGEKKLSAFKRADAFILPSKSEGMPMAVLEAWGHSLPVLMTAYCNLPLGFEQRAALEISMGEGGISAGLEQLFAMSTADLRSMGCRGRHLVETRYSWPQAAAQMEKVYEWALNGGAVPACVHF